MKLILFQLGSEDKGFIPSKRMFKEFRVMIQDCVDSKRDINMLLSHPFVTIKELEIPNNASIGIFGEGSKKDGDDKEWKEEFDKWKKEYEEWKNERSVSWWKRLLRRLAK